MGRKRVKLDSKFQPEKCSKGYHNGSDDRISQLPDDILVVILSFRSLKECARTSVLSSRWKDLWKHTKRLDFDVDNALKNKIAEPDESKGLNGPHEAYAFVKKERRKYVKWVNYVLQSHKAPTLKEFKICFDLTGSHRKDITRWLDFALAKKVEILELELLLCGYEGRPSNNYSFPEEFLARPIHFKSLRELSMKYVNVSGEAIEFFLRNCPLLEKLVVHGTDKISSLDICGSSLVLKHLELVGCYHIESVKVSAPNLTSLKVTMLEVLVVENVPMLVDVSVNLVTRSVKGVLSALTCCISQLEILHLELLHILKVRLDMSVSGYELPKLKKLVINYSPKGEESLVGLTSLISASPNLQEFVLEMLWEEVTRSDRKTKNPEKTFRHEHLKVVKFYGYYGRTKDVEIIEYILVNCVALEKIIIDPRDQLPYLAPLFGIEADAEQTARKYAKQQLEGKLPHHIELVIL